MSNALLIFNQLRAAGVSRAGALGLMGNWKAESGLEPCRLQNDFSANRIYSRSYTADVTAGRITRTQFARDQKGYGLAQWTWHTRKQNLLNCAKAQGKSIDDLQMQLEFLWQELQGYHRSMAALTAGKSIKAVSDVILTDFEKPADQSNSVKNRRDAFGKEIYDRQTGATEKKDENRKTSFVLQIGAFSKKANADKRVRSLTKKGINAKAEKVGSFWKVRYGSYQTAAEGSADRRKFLTMGINAVIVEV
jgi:hypothetical protein